MHVCGIGEAILKENWLLGQSQRGLRGLHLYGHGRKRAQEWEAGRTQEAAGDLVHEAARLQAVQAEHLCMHGCMQTSDLI